MDTSIQILEFESSNLHDRPVFEYNEVLFLFDSGSNMPVWCKGEEFFADIYKNAKKTKHVAHLSGFGKGYTIASVYFVPEFVLIKDNVRFSVINLYVAVTDFFSMEFDFILSNTVFAKADITIANRTNSLQFLFDADRTFYCTPIRLGTEVKKISVWAKE